jgi:MFS family permease
MGAFSRWLVPAIGLGILLNPLNSSMISVALPRLGETFHLSFAEVSWAVVIFYLVSAIAQPVMGRLSDVWGRKRLFLIGLVTVLAASLLAAASWNFVWLVVFRGLQALGTSMVVSVGLSIVRLSVTEGKGKAAALVSVFVSGAAAFGPAIGGFLLHWSSWQSMFFINVPFVIVSLVLAVRVVPRDTPKAEPSTRAATTASPMRLFLRSRSLILTNVEFILVNLIYYAFFFGFPTYLQGLRHLDTLQVGWLMLILGVCSLILSAFAGRWVDRMGPRPAMLTSGILMAAGCASMAALDGSSPLWFIALILVLLGAAGGLNNVSLQVAMFRSAPPAISGLASGLFLTARYGGTILASLVLDFAFPHAPSVSGLQSLAVILVAVTLTFLGLALAHRRFDIPEVSPASVL